MTASQATDLVSFRGPRSNPPFAAPRVLLEPTTRIELVTYGLRNQEAPTHENPFIQASNVPRESPSRPCYQACYQSDEQNSKIDRRMVIFGDPIGVKRSVARDHTRRWQALESAARHLDIDATTLRKRAERLSKCGTDGVREAAFDGLRCRKLAGRWKVLLSEGWDVDESVTPRTDPSGRAFD